MTSPWIRIFARPRTGLAAGLAAVLLASAPAGAQTRVDLTPEQQRAFGIELAAPLPAEAALSRRYPAQISVPNPQQRVIATPQAGVIEALLVAEGERVQPGQVLARLQSPQLVETQSAYLEALARLELAESELARDRMLHREGVIAERRLLESTAKDKELAALAQQRRQLLELAGLSAEDIDTLKRTRQLSSTLPIRTAIGGVVLEQMVNTGQSLAAAEPMYRVAELTPLWVEVHVPVDRIAGVEVGGRVLLPTLDVSGDIISVGRMVHGEDQGVLVRAEIRDGAELLRPGQFVEVQLAAATQQAAAETWRLPSAALVRNAGDVFVFAKRGDGFAVLPVSVLAEEEQSAVIAAALRRDDQVVIGGTVALKAAWLAGQDEAAPPDAADGGQSADETATAGSR